MTESTVAPVAEPSSAQPTIQPEVEFKPRLDIENETAEEEAQLFDEEDAEEDDTEEPEEPTPAPLKPFKEFFGLNQLFTDVCRGLTTDGRNAPFYRLVSAHADDYRFTCAACRALLNSFEVPCRPKRVKVPKAKKGEPPIPTPTPIARQREPHPELINLTSSLFGELAKNAKFAEEITQSIRELDRLISAEKWSSVAEKEYFTAFMDAIKAPFVTNIRRQERAEKRAAENHQPVSQEASKKALDDLF